MKCPFKCDSEDNQEHLLEGEEIETNSLRDKMPKSEELFSAEISQRRS